MTRSFSVMVGTTPTLLAAPDWVNGLALPFAIQTASFTVTTAMLGLTVPYSAAGVGTVTIPLGLTPVIGAEVKLGQLGAGTISVVGSGGAVVKGQPVSYAPNQVLRAVQGPLDTWTVNTHSWDLPQFMYGNPNGQPLLVSYGRITFSNPSAASMLIDTNPAVAWAGIGTVIPAATSVTKEYGNGPSELWYGVVQTTPAAINIWTGPAPSTS
jgi:hypothetical protein